MGNFLFCIKVKTETYPQVNEAAKAKRGRSYAGIARWSTWG
jgi:hypothetical protein